MSSKTYPTIEFERSLTQGGVRFIIGIDEVGRGAVAGPVAVGVALIDTHSPAFADIPSGLRDSKLLSERQREALQPLIETWMHAGSVGMIDASAIDNGKGGTVVLWSDVRNAMSVTTASGVIYAKGGAQGGDGNHPVLPHDAL